MKKGEVFFLGSWVGGRGKGLGIWETRCCWFVVVVEDFWPGEGGGRETWSVFSRIFHKPEGPSINCDL